MKIWKNVDEILIINKQTIENFKLNIKAIIKLLQEVKNKYTCLYNREFYEKKNCN